MNRTESPSTRLRMDENESPTCHTNNSYPDVSVERTQILYGSEEGGVVGPLDTIRRRQIGRLRYVVGSERDG